MKHLLIIKIYWLIIPASKRKHCIFKESCSRYVFRNTQEQGLIQGLKALNFRYKNCRPGYQLMELDNEVIMISKNNMAFSENEIASRTLMK